MVGLALAVLIPLAHVLAPGTGLAAAAGPRPDRVLVQVGVGLVGELAHFGRRRLPVVLRTVAAVLVIVAVLAALWFAWWR